MSYVVKGTPPGFDVGTAIDYLQTFNTGWPLLKLHDTGTSSTTITHNLGYVPLFFTTLGSGGFAPGAVDQNSHGTWDASTTQLVATSAPSTRYYIFRQSLTSNFTANVISGNNTAGQKTDGYVFKMTKEGKDTSSTDMRDFALHSGTVSPMIHKVDHGAMTNIGGGILERVVTHNLGYAPMVFVYMQPGANTLSLSTTRYGIVMPQVGVSGRYYENSSTTVRVVADTTFFNGTPNVSVVIMKNPFDLDTVSVSV